MSYSGSVSGALIQTVGKTATTTQVISSRNPSNWLDMVSFTASVSAPSATGSVTFYDGSATLGQGASVGGGKWVLSVSNLAVGTHSIKAVYSGDATFAGSTSPVITQTVNNAATPDFSISASPSTVNTRTGAVAQYTVSVNGTGGFSGTVSFSMTSQPAGPVATFSPATVTGSGSTVMSVPANAKGTYTLTITASSGTLVRTRTVTMKVTGR
jgi:hypothetical protein